MDKKKAKHKKYHKHQTQILGDKDGDRDGNRDGDRDVLRGRLHELFKIQPKLISKLEYQIKEKYANPKIKTLSPEIINKLIVNLFSTDYFPSVSHNIHIDKNNQAIIMGGIAFNMNIPKDMQFLKLDTDDVDLKIYTTSINYSKKTEKDVIKVLSIFRFCIIIICFYLKQVLEIVKNICIKLCSRDKKYLEKGILDKYEIIIQLKLKNENNINELVDKLELSKLTYSEIYNTITTKINNIDLMMTNKINYSIKLTGNKNRNKSITFSDTKVIYANTENPAFYSYYLLNNPKLIGKNLGEFINQSIFIDDLLDVKSCGNNCKYLDVNTLLLDTVIMLSYADLLEYEKIDIDGKVLVPISFLFKYYKYLIKYLRLYIIKKYYERKLNNNLLNSARELWTYALTNLKQNTSIIETEDINIAYKKMLNEFHQNLFINKSLLTKYPDLKDAVNEYSIMVYFINSSRALFKDLDAKSKHTGETLASITIQMADKKLLDSNMNLEEYSKTMDKIHLNSHFGGAIKSHMLSNEISSELSEHEPEVHNSDKLSGKQQKIIISRLTKIFTNERKILNMTKKILHSSANANTKHTKHTKTRH
jgi:hypothetical protein